MSPRTPLYLDVRSPEEHAEARFEPSVNIPVDALPERLAELGANKTREIVVYCRSGRRSALAAALLREAGFLHVRDAGGLTDLLASSDSARS